MYLSLLHESSEQEDARRARPGALLREIGYLEHIGDRIGVEIATADALDMAVNTMGAHTVAAGW